MSGRRRRHLEMELCGLSALGVGVTKGFLGTLIEVVVLETVPPHKQREREKVKVREMCGVCRVCVCVWQWALKGER